MNERMEPEREREMGWDREKVGRRKEEPVDRVKEERSRGTVVLGKSQV